MSTAAASDGGSEVFVCLFSEREVESRDDWKMQSPRWMRENGES